MTNLHILYYSVLSVRIFIILIRVKFPNGVAFHSSNRKDRRPSGLLHSLPQRTPFLLLAPISQTPKRVPSEDTPDTCKFNSDGIKTDVKKATKQITKVDKGPSDNRLCAAYFTWRVPDLHSGHLLTALLF